jgi:hypothetical protein
MEKRMLRLEDAENVKKLIKPLRELTELYGWIVHTEKMIAKVDGLEKEREILETVIGDNIFNEDCKRWFLRGNQKEKGGLKYLLNFLESDLVRNQIEEVERRYTQKDGVNNNKIDLIEYIEKKRMLLLAKEKKFREDESNQWSEMLRLIKKDMSAEDVKNLGPTTKYSDFDELLLICEEVAQLELKERKETKSVSMVKKEERKEREEDSKREKSKRFDGECFYCKKKGHRAIDCWKKKEEKEKKKGKDGGRDISSVRCFKCGKMGHYVLIFCRNALNFDVR